MRNARKTLRTNLAGMAGATALNSPAGVLFLALMFGVALNCSFALGLIPAATAGILWDTLLRPLDPTAWRLPAFLRRGDAL